MIARADVTAWRSRAPWPSDEQVEQDLIISRVLVELFSEPQLSASLAFRGGTALHKLCFDHPGRYSEDIDLVQVEAGPIGDLLDAIRHQLDPWLGTPKRKRGHGRVTALYRFESASLPARRMRLKIEINFREHFSVFGFETKDFEMSSRWFSGRSSVLTYALDKLLGTKLRALYQRRKGRDLFDLWYAAHHAKVDSDRLIACFLEYLERAGLRISRAEFEENFAEKRAHPDFASDLRPLLNPDVEWSFKEAANWLASEILPRLPGEPWQGAEGQVRSRET